MAFQTISYSETVKGFPSFYSYEPDWMIGMNNYFYSFKGGNLWRHNSSAVNRCTFYGDFANATISSTFNQSPLESKLFKTINLESDAAWGFLGTTDMGSAGFTTSAEFIQKEGAWYAHINFQTQNNPVGTGNYPLRLTNGIGNSDNVDATAPAATIITFPAGVEINSIPSVGDGVYYVANPVAPPGVNNLEYMGNIVGINRGTRQLTVDMTVPNAVPPPAATNCFFNYVKNPVAESYGALGHYLNFTLTNTNTTAVELFAVESQVMKSYP